MSDYVYEGTGTLPDGKSDAAPLSVPANKGITAAEWNTVNQAIKDLRASVLAGKFHGLTEYAAALSGAGLGRFSVQDGRIKISENAGPYRIVKHPDVNVLDFGADPTGVADSAAAFMAAIASFGPSTGATASNAGCVVVPPGKYRLASTVRVKKSVWIKGSHAAAGCAILPDPGITAFKFERYNVSTDLGTGAADLARISNLQIYNPSHKVAVRQQSHAYAVGDRMKVGPTPGQGAIPFTDINEFYRHYECTTAGTSAASATGPRSFGTDQTLNYDGQLVNFTVGNFVYGATSGAFGQVIADTDAGSTGTLRLTSWNNTPFQDNENITDGVSTVLAVANGTNVTAVTDELDGTVRWRYIGSGAALHIRANGVVCQDMMIGSMSGAGCHIVGGDLENPGAFVNSNGWQFYAGSITGCDGPAFYIRGSDTNGGLCIGTAMGGNGGASSDGDFTGPDYNIRDCSFLGNTYLGIEIYTVGGQGAVYTTSVGGGFCALGCYLEGTGGGPCVATNGGVVLGGALAGAEWRGSAAPSWIQSAVALVGPGGSLNMRNKIRGYGAYNIWRGLATIPTGLLRTNGSNVYRCVTPGVTAASGGPTGTGTGIVDGSVVWDYVAAISNGEGYSNLGSADPDLQAVHSTQSPDDVGVALGWTDKFTPNSGIATKVRVQQYGSSGPNPASFEGNGIGRHIAINRTILTETPQKIPAGKEMVDMMWLGGVRIMGTDTATDPAAGTYSKGDLILYKRGAVSAGAAIGRRCTVEGTAGTYAGGRTATANGTTTVAISGAAMPSLVDQQHFKVGDKLVINGVTSRVQAVDQTSPNYGLSLTMGSAVTAGSGLAIAFSPPTWEEFGVGAAPALTAVGSSPSANGATLSGQTLTLQPADATHPGLLTILAQAIAGIKTFSDTIKSTVASGSYVLSAASDTWGVKFVTDKMQFFAQSVKLFEIDSVAGKLLSNYDFTPMAAGVRDLGDTTNYWRSAVVQFLRDTAAQNRISIPVADLTTYTSWVANGASAIAHKFISQNALSTAGAKIAAFYRDAGTTEIANILKNGTFQSLAADGDYLFKGLGTTAMGLWANAGVLNLEVAGVVVGILSSAAADFNGAGYLRAKKLLISEYTDGSGTAGNQTINKARGKFKIAAGGSSCTITNDHIDTDAFVACWPETNDTTAQVKNITKSGTGFTVNLVSACTADTVFMFFLVN